MPLLVTPALPTGTLRSTPQPTLPVDGELTLRPWRAADAPTVRTAFSDPGIQRWHLRGMDSDAEAREWATAWAECWQAESKISWAIVDGADEPRGQVGLRNVSLFEASADVSYWVLPTARGAGIAVRAVATLTEWAFGTVRLNRLSIVHSMKNTGSCRVASKSGFDLEGIQRQAYRHEDGWHDMHGHARLRQD